LTYKSHTAQDSVWLCSLKVEAAQLRYVVYALGHIKIYWFARSPKVFKSSLDYEFWTHKAHIMISPLPEDRE
jgi:hypothetical protein